MNEMSGTSFNVNQSWHGGSSKWSDMQSTNLVVKILSLRMHYKIQCYVPLPVLSFGKLGTRPGLETV